MRGRVGRSSEGGVEKTSVRTEERRRLEENRDKDAKRTDDEEGCRKRAGGRMGKVMEGNGES